MPDQKEILTWAGVQSTVNVIPLNEKGDALLHFLQLTKCSLRTPSEDQKTNWPLNSLFDWLWSSRIARQYGTKEFFNFSKNSEVTKAIEKYRQGLKKRKQQQSDGDKAFYVDEGYISSAST